MGRMIEDVSTVPILIMLGFFRLLCAFGTVLFFVYTAAVPSAGWLLLGFFAGWLLCGFLADAIRNPGR